MKLAFVILAGILAQTQGFAAPDDAATEFAAAKLAYDARNVASGYRLAGAYQRLGSFHAGRGYYPAALQNYNGALLILNQIASGNRADPRVRGELLGVAGRVRALGGTIPVWINVPIGGQANAEPEQPRPVVMREPVPDIPMPDLNIATLAESERKACEDALERYIQTAATAQASRNVISGLRASVESHGLSLRADYVAADSRIRLRMDSAKRSIEAQKCAAGMESLTIASEEIRRLLRELGQ